MFGDANASAGDSESGCGGNVERARAIAAGAARVDNRPRRRAMARREERPGVATHGASETDQLVDGLALHAQSDEQAGDLRVGGGSGENVLHHGFGASGVEMAAGGERFERFVDHFGGHFSVGGGRRSLPICRLTSKLARFMGKSRL